MKTATQSLNPFAHANENVWGVIPPITTRCNTDFLAQFAAELEAEKQIDDLKAMMLRSHFMGEDNA